MYKRIVVGLIVAFVVAAAMPLVAQAQERPPVNIVSVQNCKYVGPAEPLSLNTVLCQRFQCGEDDQGAEGDLLLLQAGRHAS
jgi:hypothetical protein